MNPIKDPSDNLTPLARRILKQNADTAYEKLTIGPASGNPLAFQDLDSASPRALCAHFVTHEPDAHALLAALWLWQDYLQPAHDLCQNLHTPSGSYWHAILHRREGDFSNAKYWYAQAQSHPALQSFAHSAAETLRDAPADKTLLRITSSPNPGLPLTDLVASVHASPNHPLHRTAISLQQLEFRILFEFCAASAQR